jgi:predicted DCC family thiol-disulfide oxidoreductase YuxK
MTDEAPSRPVLSPSKTVLVFDGECAFCMAWVDGVRRRKGQELECVAYQDASVPARFPNLAPERLRRSVHLIEADGHVHRGAQAVLRAPGGGRTQATLLRLCERSAGFARLADFVYRVVAKNRRALSLVLPRPRPRG